MIISILGKSNSGKSLEIEKKIENEDGNRLYVGTLPHYPDYDEVISRHMARRNSSWDLLELTGEIDKDITILLQKIPLYQNILIDGQIIYIIRAVVEFGIRWEEKAAQIELLLEAMREQNTIIFIIDSLADRKIEPYFRKYTLLWHRMLKSFSEEMYYFDNNTLNKLSGKIPLI